MAIADNCNGRIIAVGATTGNTLTRADVRGMTPAMFEAQDMIEVGMDRVYARAKEARVAGVMENSLEMLMMSRVTPIKGALTKQSLPGNESVVLPYFPRRQKRNINSNWFQVTAGAATSGAGTGGVPASSWSITVQKHTGPFASDLQQLERYFLPGKYLIVDWYNGTTKVGYSAQFKILGATNADAGGVNKATIQLEPCATPGGWAGYSAGQKLPYQPTLGVCYILANSISDYESWCYNDVAENTNKLLTFWLQTSRYTHQYNDEYLKHLNASLLSNYYKDFRLLPLAEQKRIMYQKHLKAWYNSIFFGQEINEQQTVEGYRNLPTVVDPANTGMTLEYKANSLGFLRQLDLCGRVYDKQGGALDLNFLFEVGYLMKRAREADGTSVECIDWMTDRWTADAILVKMIGFFKTKYQYDVTKYIEQGAALKFENQILLQYNKFQLPPALGGYTVAIFWHEFFDDRLSAFAAPIKGNNPTGDLANSGRYMFGIDWTDFQLGIAATNSAMRQTNFPADALYNCVLKANITHYMLESTTWSTILEDPMRHAVVKNFGDATNASFLPVLV